MTNTHQEPSPGVKSGRLRLAAEVREWVWRDLTARTAPDLRPSISTVRTGAMVALARAGAVRPGEMAAMAVSALDPARGRVTVARYPQHGYDAGPGHRQWAGFPVDDAGWIMLGRWASVRAELLDQLEGAHPSQFFLTVRPGRRFGRVYPAGLSVMAPALERSWRRYAAWATATPDFQMHFPGRVLSSRYEAVRKAWQTP